MPQDMPDCTPWPDPADEEILYECPVCETTWIVRMRYDTGTWDYLDDTTCPRCHAEGKAMDDE